MSLSVKTIILHEKSNFQKSGLWYKFADCLTFWKLCGKMGLELQDEEKRYKNTYVDNRKNCSYYVSDFQFILTEI